MKTLCSDKEPWEDLDKDDSDDAPVINFCKANAVGRMCKKTLAQLHEYAGDYSSPEEACLGLLLCSTEKLKKKEKKVLGLAFAISRSEYDKTMNKNLLNDVRFHQNAKIIVLLKELGEGGRAGIIPEIAIKATFSKPD